MRFNDLLRTVLANAGEGASAAITRWRQCVDLLAQYDVSGARSGPGISPQERNVVLSIIEDMRPRVGLDQRIASVVELGSRLRSPALVRLLSQDHPSLVVAMMGVVRLTGEDWARIIPDLGPLARSVLRGRRDLDSTARAALRQFGEIDLSLPSHPSTQAAEVVQNNHQAGLERAEEAAARPANKPIHDSASQIGRLVERIERFKNARADSQNVGVAPVIDQDAAPAIEAETPLELTSEQSAPDHFLFETDGVGVVQIVDGAPRGALMGLNISSPSIDSLHGVDGATLGAFRHRAAFENARLLLPDGLLAGEWRIEGEPHFDRSSGRFLGYTGSARREQRYESPVRSHAASDEPAAGLSAASMRQLIHELRTPLNAVQGYSEMIEAQILGPVPDAYRDMARSIMSDARALIDTFDDLDLASRIIRGDTSPVTEPVDLASVLRALLSSLDVERAGQVDLSIGHDVPMILGDRAHVERMLSHLVRAGIAALEQRERLAISLGAELGTNAVSLAVARPHALQGKDDAELFEQRFIVDEQLRDEGPVLGLAFTLRLVRGIVRHLGGTFSITPTQFLIRLTSQPMSGASHENKG